jgi:alpha-mannosidase
VDLWDELLSLAESDPAFRFLMDGQAVVIEDYLAIRPGARERVDRAVTRGAITVGPWYTLPDEFLVSGETLVRNLERGIAVAQSHGGAMRTGYLPDTFGHAAQMPQIYRQFGFRHAVVWRGVPSTIDRLAFIWQGPDGTRVLTAYMASSYSQGVDLPLDGPGLAARMRAALQALAPFHPGPDVLLMNGNDHVHPQQRLSRAVREAEDHLDGVQLRLARLDDYLARLDDGGWPVWQGELRSSARANILMGTLSVRVPDKQEYFLASRALERYAEPLAALAGLDASGLLQQAWTLMLQNAAHDTACGSGIDAVAEESLVRSRSALQLADAVRDRASPRLVSGPPPTSEPPLVWNPSPFSRAGLVDITLPATPEGAQDLGPAPSPPIQTFRFARAELARVLSSLDEQRILGAAVQRVDFERRA